MQFFQKNKEQSNQNLNSYNTKDEDSHYLCFSSASPLARANARSTIDLCTGNRFCFFASQKGGFIYVFPVSAPHGISPRAAWTPSAGCWDATLVRLLSLEPRRKILSVGYDLFCRVELVPCVSRAPSSH